MTTPQNHQQISSLLRRERERAGLTVRQVADAAGLVPSTVSRLESGLIASPRPDHLQKLAKALRIDAEELYAAVGYMTPSDLPPLRTYLRNKYGIPANLADRIEGYIDSVRERTDQATKEGRHDSSRDNAP